MRWLLRLYRRIAFRSSLLIGTDGRLLLAFSERANMSHSTLRILPTGFLDAWLDSRWFPLNEQDLYSYSSRSASAMGRFPALAFRSGNVHNWNSLRWGSRMPQWMFPVSIILQDVKESAASLPQHADPMYPGL